MPPRTEAHRTPAALQVVVLEHNDTLRAVLRDSLSSRGLGEVTAFGQMADLRQHMTQHTPDVLVLDLDLPGMEGLDLCSELRTRLPDLALMATSAQLRGDWRAAALNAGADHLFAKPVLVTELVAGIRRVLNRRPTGVGGNSSTVMH